jgi:putative DNA primase/helicase
MMAAEIAGVLGDARPEGRAWRCRCPLHGGRSLIVRDGDGGCVLVTCWGGCDRLAVLTELRRLDLLGRRGEFESRLNTRLRRDADHRADEARRITLARRVWDEACDARESAVERYLAGRGIVLDAWPASVRYHPSCPRGRTECMPAMVALAECVERGIVGLHRTFLTPDYRRHDRASLGTVGGGAVRFGNPCAGEWFAVAEGIETTAAVVVACGMPAWAALSAEGIRALKLSPEATHVVICADHDASGTGERAARDAAVRWLGEGRQVRLAIPPEPGTDMADLLVANGMTREARHVA